MMQYLRNLSPYYKDKTLDFLGIDLAAITEPLNTESTEVELKKSYADLLFGLADHTGLPMGWEADISEDDMLRFYLITQRRPDATKCRS